jgi:ferredoxin--NADP+ reductase
MYERTCSDPRVRFLGNVAYGRDLTLDDLQRHYHAVVFAVGAASDRSLGIPGEDLARSLSATEFVAWYNGHPDYVDLDPDLSGSAVVVIGMGNVAVDVVRILAKSTDELAETDIADHALAHLAGSRVEDVYMIGRRGPAQGKFTTKELRELGELAHADIVVDPGQLELDPASERALEGDRAQTRNVEILRGFAAKRSEGKPRRVHIRFLASPVELIGTDAVQSVRLERNTLEEREGGYLAAVGSGEFDEIPAQMVLRSVGYRGVALDNVPFDARRGVVPNALGRVLHEPGGDTVSGMYVAGWIKRGPSGVIGTNKADAMETVAQLLDDRPEEAVEPLSSADAGDALLAERGVRTFDFEAWRRLDAAEVAAGEPLGRPRVKVVDVAEMLGHAEP